MNYIFLTVSLFIGCICYIIIELFRLSSFIGCKLHTKYLIVYFVSHVTLTFVRLYNELKYCSINRSICFTTTHTSRSSCALSEQHSIAGTATTASTIPYAFAKSTGYDDATWAAKQHGAGTTKKSNRWSTTTATTGRLSTNATTRYGFLCNHNKLSC